MCEEPNAGTSELQKLLDEGVASVALGTAAGRQKAPILIDITKEFLAECSKMNLGELAKSSNFQLSEAMSAIELMDPKMDIGMVAFDPSIRFENLVAAGRLNVTDMEPRELIATMDAMLVSLMSWLDGNSIAQTLLTCVCLHDVPAIGDTTLASFCYGILELAITSRHIIQTAAVYEEEDFNGYFSSDIKTMSMGHLLNALKTAENELQRKLRHKRENAELLEAIFSRISFVRLIILSLSALVPPPLPHTNAALSSQAFRPSLDDASVHMRAACSLLEKIESTISLGLSAPNDCDGDFAWLPAFEPEVNRRCLPPTFPRKTQMLSRVEGIGCLRSLASRILNITTELPNRIANIESTLFYLRSFSLSGSCVLSRSLLQLVYLPSDDHIMGRTPLSAVIIESLRLFAAPPILDPTCSLSSDSRCRATWDEFISDAVKVFLGVIQMFGLNLARQREKIVCCVEDFSALQNEAERLEADFDACLASSTSSVTLSLTSFVLYHTLLLIEYHFYLSFRLDLFAPFEYPYVYWYMSEVIFKWLLNTIDRSHTLIITDYKKSIKDKKKADRRRNFKSKKETDLRKRISEGQRSLLFYKAQAALAEALFKVSVGLISVGKIHLPLVDTDAERLRFEHRMLPFSALSPPLLLSYFQFTQMSRIEALLMLGSSKCFLQAAEAFEFARSQLEKFEGVGSLDCEAAAIALICKRNAVVARILSSGNKIDVGFRIDDQFRVHRQLIGVSIAQNQLIRVLVTL
uniref:Protein MAK10 homolog n=1 Tax=Ascaris suum TaxID=6253 RepID=F1KY43_ASCSU